MARVEDNYMMVRPSKLHVPVRIAGIAQLLPRGRTVPQTEWRRRHSAMVSLLGLHVPVLAAIGLVEGFTLASSATQPLLLVPFALLAVLDTNPRRAAVSASLGLLVASGLVVYIEHGAIEAHFHVFAILAVLALYEDWLPILTGFGLAVLHHGALGILDGAVVYDHAGDSLALAAVPGGFVLAAAIMNVVAWRFNEDVRAAATRATDEVRLLDLRFRSAFNDAPIGMALLDRAGRFIRVNRRLRIMVERSEERLLESGLPLVGHLGSIAGLLEQDGGHERRLATEGGRTVWALCSASKLEGSAEGHSILQIVDITERKEAEAALVRQTIRDGLTLLPNRDYFVERLRDALSRKPHPGARLAVLFVDIDNFKLVNDTLGRAAGDELLVQIGRTLCAAVRNGDMVARLSGDEFAVMCEKLDRPSQVQAIADRIAKALAAPMMIGDQEVCVSASVGIAAARDDHREPDALLHEADLAMYRAKEMGKARSETFDAQMRLTADRRLEIETDLRRAVGRDELRLHYQPQICTRTGAIVGVEALVRWQHPREGLLPPSEFITVAEETGMIREIGAWALREACQQSARWLADGVGDPELTMAVNVSPRQLLYTDLESAVHRALELSRIPPERLELEITESAIVEDRASAVEPLRRLHAMGVHVSIDDFGVGASSISYLKRFDFVRALKIDRSFVAGLLDRAHDEAIVRSILALADAFGLTAVAEGVEDETQLERLRELECDVVQGYLFAKPLPVEAMTEFLCLPRLASVA